MGLRLGAHGGGFATGQDRGSNGAGSLCRDGRFGTGFGCWVWIAIADASWYGEQHRLCGWNHQVSEPRLEASGSHLALDLASGCRRSECLRQDSGEPVPIGFGSQVLQILTVVLIVPGEGFSGPRGGGLGFAVVTEEARVG